MQTGQRAYLYVRRKAGKSILLLLVMLLLFSFVMAGLLLYSAADLAIRQARQSLGGGFRISPDMQNRENVMITEADGQTSVTYIGAPLDEALIRAVRAREEVDDYNAVIKGKMLLQGDLCLIDYNGIYRDDPIASRLVSVEADTSLLLSPAFQAGRVKLTGGGMPGMGDGGGAVISEALAKENGLHIGDEIRLSPREGHAGQPVTVKIRGLFTVEADRQITDAAAPVHLLENRIFLHMAGGRALTGAEGADYVDFFVGDPAQVYQLMEKIKAMDGINWSCFALTARIEEYEKAAGPLLDIRKLAGTLLTVVVIAGMAVLSLIQALFHKSRRHELGIMLSMGISKGEILLQRFMETVFIAAAALVLSACAISLLLPLLGRAVYRNMDETVQVGAGSVIALLAAAAGCGVWVLFLSTAFSILGDMRRKPGEILSRLS